MTLQLTTALQEELNHLAVERGISVDELAHRAIRDFIVQQRDFDAAERRGDSDIAAHRVLEHDEVVSRIERLLAPQ